MKYKIGNTVCIKSMSDIGKIIDSKGCVGGLPFKVAMNNYCSSRMTIDQIDDINGYYRMKEDPWHFYNDEMIERLVEDLLDKEIQEHQRMCDEIMDIQGIEPIEAEIEQIIHCPDGYIFKDENGNVINAQKIVLEKEKEYPKTYEECLKVLNIEGGRLCFNNSGITQYERDLYIMMNNLSKLLICRAAYWKITGDEMGLGKPWEPNWTSFEGFPAIYMYRYQITLSVAKDVHHCLVFPTEEMRDAFYENFKKEIEICKEFL